MILQPYSSCPHPSRSTQSFHTRSCGVFLSHADGRSFFCTQKAQKYTEFATQFSHAKAQRARKLISRRRRRQAQRLRDSLRLSVRINIGNDIGVDPKLHFIPPPRQRRYSPYLKETIRFFKRVHSHTPSPPKAVLPLS